MAQVANIHIEAERPDREPRQDVVVPITPSTTTLYICYFGLREPLVQTQVLPYLRQLVSDGVAVSLLTFEPKFREKWSQREIEEERTRMASEGISWSCLAYHKWPSLPATLFDIASGTWLTLRLMRRYGIEILHARNHVPALIGALAKRINGGRLIFDIRGFMPEEYTDGGVWPEGGYLYRGMKRVEKYLFRVSDGFVVLTDKAREILFPGCSDADDLGRPIEVIPCCVDFARFSAAEEASREELRSEFNLTGRRVIVYIGSFGGWYLTDEMTQFLAYAHNRDPTTFSMILTQSPHELVVERMRNLGLDEKDVLVDTVRPEDVPRYLKAADFAISFIKACYSKQSSSPTKIAEYLASGLPVVCNAGVGDLDRLIEEDRVGVIVREFTPLAYDHALSEVEALLRNKEFAEKCRAVARARFDLVQVGGVRYTRLYRRLLRSEEHLPVDRRDATSEYFSEDLTDNKLGSRQEPLQRQTQLRLSPFLDR